VQLSCSTTLAQNQVWARKQAVFLNGNGGAIRLLTQAEKQASKRKNNELDSAEFAAALDSIRQTIVDWRKTKSNGGNGPIRIVLFVHGGLNSPGSALKKMVELDSAIKRNNMLPLYINWNSDAVTAYTDHLLHVRQGQRFHWTWLNFFPGILTTGITLGEDFGRGVVETPGALVVEAKNIWYDAVLNRSRTRKTTDAVLDTVSNRNGDPLAIKYGVYHRTQWEALGSRLTALPWFAVHALTLPVVLMIGPPGWDNMVGRTRNAFRTPSEFEHLKKANGSVLGERGATGGAALFVQVLRQAMERGDSIELIGHSMGAILSDRLLEYELGLRGSIKEGSPQRELPISNVVYVGAANTIASMEEAVIPFMRNSPGTTFHVVNLHPLAESREAMISGSSDFADWFQLIPRGSFPVYLDDYLRHPVTEDDRVLGKQENIIRVLHVFPADIRDRVTVKWFGFRDTTVNNGFGADHKLPRVHGDLAIAGVCFWLASYQELRTQIRTHSQQLRIGPQLPADTTSVPCT
jgi:hypothetical protein